MSVPVGGAYPQISAASSETRLGHLTPARPHHRWGPWGGVGGTGRTPTPGLVFLFFGREHLVDPRGSGAGMGRGGPSPLPPFFFFLLIRTWGGRGMRDRAHARRVQRHRGGGRGSSSNPKAETGARVSPPPRSSTSGPRLGKRREWHPPAGTPASTQKGPWRPSRARPVLSLRMGIWPSSSRGGASNDRNHTHTPTPPGRTSPAPRVAGGGELSFPGGQHGRAGSLSPCGTGRGQTSGDGAVIRRRTPSSPPHSPRRPRSVPPARGGTPASAGRHVQAAQEASEGRSLILLQVQSPATG